MRSLFMLHGHIVSSRLRRTDSTPILGRMLFQAGSLLLVIISVYLLKRIHIFSDKSYKVVQGWCSISPCRAPTRSQQWP